MPKRPHRSRSKRRPLLRQSEDSRDNALHALNLMRVKDVSLAHAVKEYHVAPRTILKYAGRALIRGANGRYRAKPFDRLRRSMLFISPESDEPVKIVIHSSKTAS